MYSFVSPDNENYSAYSENCKRGLWDLISYQHPVINLFLYFCYICKQIWVFPKIVFIPYSNKWIYRSGTWNLTIFFNLSISNHLQEITYTQQRSRSNLSTHCYLMSKSIMSNIVIGQFQNYKYRMWLQNLEVVW